MLCGQKLMLSLVRCSCFLQCISLRFLKISRKQIDNLERKHFMEFSESAEAENQP